MSCTAAPAGCKERDSQYLTVVSVLLNTRLQDVLHFIEVERVYVDEKALRI